MVPAGSSPEVRQAYVAERVNARWAALIKDDRDAAYTFMSPGSREVTSLEKFKSTIRRGAFRQVVVEAVTCEGDACRVRLMLTYDHRLMKGITTPVNEVWIFERGQAWYVN
ncbi:MAG: hypothetical protein ABIP94_03255 [Planctomycetota bacterium]